MNKEHVTKGPVYFRSGISPHFQGTVIREDGKGETIALTYNDEEAANAELIAEAFNVLHETGYTPAELVKILKDAHEAMGKVAAMCQVHNPHTGFLNDVNPYDAYRILLPSMVKAGEVFAKYQPVTPA